MTPEPPVHAAFRREKLHNTPDERRDAARQLHRAVCGSPIGDSNEHNHKRVPFFIGGRAGGALKGGIHVKAATGTPLANAMLSVLHALGHDHLASFGDSEGALSVNPG
jgi:hypothetical protein